MKVFLLLFVCLVAPLYAKPLVVVSVAPQKYLVERIAGESVDVEVLVPAGASPHFYEPTSRQLLRARGGKIWFRIGEGFETMVLRAMKSSMDVVEVRYERDPHIWLSTALLKSQAETMTGHLSKLVPECAETYTKNLQALRIELDALDAEILELVEESSAARTLLVSHPAFGYFCRDYGFKQLSIEFHGKEPSPRQMTNLLLKARELKIHKIFVQPQYSTKGAERLAAELKAEIEIVDPYKENVVENLRQIAHCFTR